MSCGPRERLLAQVLLALLTVFVLTVAAVGQTPQHPLNPHTQIKWPPCAGGASVYSIVSNTCVATGGPAGPVRWSCQPGLGGGLNAIDAGTYPQIGCYNDTGATVTLSAINCFTDNNGASTLNVSLHSGAALLTGAVTCSNTFAAGTQSATVTIANGDWLVFSFVSDGTTNTTTWKATGTY